VDVIDTVITKANESIPVNGSVHNVYVTPDGKYAVSGSIENKAATVIDFGNRESSMADQVSIDPSGRWL